jgi:hypothetical protein
MDNDIEHLNQVFQTLLKVSFAEEWNKSKQKSNTFKI